MRSVAALRGVWDWVERARGLISEGDRRVLLSPAQLFGRFVKYALLHEGKGARAEELDARDPALVELFVDLFRAIGEVYFRVRFEGQHHVPKEGGVLLVGNHNGGLVPADSFMTGVALFDSQPRERAMFALAHDFLFDDEVLRRFATRLGILRAGHEGAGRALSAGHMVLVYPGSDYDAFRPYSDRHKVVLAGRKGFLKLALTRGVPIVPVVANGSHEQFVVLTRGEAIGRRIGMHRLARTDILPIILALPWGLTHGFVPYIPWPARVSIAFGEPIRFPDLGPEAVDDPAAMEACYREVESRMQGMLDRLVRDDEAREVARRRGRAVAAS